MFIRIIIVLVAIFGSGALSASAQIFKTLYNFSGTSGWPPINPDGAQPYYTGVVLSGNTLYGTTYYGGTNGCGVVFSVKTDGSGFNVLHTFSGASPAPDYTNADGQFPQGSLTLVGDTLYGTALNGGVVSGGNGTIYSIKTNGNDFTLLHSFDYTNGSGPNGPLVIADGKIYGTTEYGGSPNYGTVFSINLDGTEFTLLHTFTYTDGVLPNGVVLASGTLYGTAQNGGAYGRGNIFSVKTNGGNFTVLHNFSAGNAGFYNQFNDDGNHPVMPGVVDGDTIYGTATFGGYYGRGTLFSLKTNGTSFTVLRSFADNDPGNERSYQDGGGSYPISVTATNGVLYGEANTGGYGGNGTLFSMNSDGSHFTVLHSFAALQFPVQTNFDGCYPDGILVLSGNTLYGTAEQGGQKNGTVFSVVVQPAIASIQLAGTNLVLSGFNGIQGENCVTLASLDMTLPLSNWVPIATNTLPAGDFTITVTNAIDSSASKYFYILKGQ